MRCPVCQLELGVERQAGEVVLTYSFKDWAERCRYQRGDPGLCANLSNGAEHLTRIGVEELTTL